MTSSPCRARDESEGKYYEETAPRSFINASRLRGPCQPESQGLEPAQRSDNAEVAAGRALGIRRGRQVNCPYVAFDPRAVEAGWDTVLLQGSMAAVSRKQPCLQHEPHPILRFSA